MTKIINPRFNRHRMYRARVISIQGATKKEHRVTKLVASLDHFVVRLVLVLIVGYIVAYGYLVSKGFTFGQPSWHYALALIPLWLIDGLKGMVENFISATYKTAEEDLSKVTVVVPSKDGGAALGRTLTDLLGRFAPDHIIVVSNGSTDNTVAIAHNHGVMCLDIEAPVGKVRAIDYAIEHIATPYALLIDDDTLIGEAHIPTALLEQGYEAVAFRVLVNTSTWVTKLQMYEYRKSTDIGKRFHNRRASVQNISGAIGLFNVSELQRQIDRHTHEFAGEDLQRTLLLHLASKKKGVVLTDSTVYTDPPTTLGTLFNQRTLGWFPGLYVNFKNYVRLMFRHGAPLPLRYDAFYNAVLVMIFDVFRLLSLPVLLFYPWYFVYMYATYFVLEMISYLKCGRQDPFWVVLAYPFYGLFGFITRICAMCVFVYRRIVAKLAQAVYFDDYKAASGFTKVVTVIGVAIIIQAVLVLYITFSYAKLVGRLTALFILWR